MARAFTRCKRLLPKSVPRLLYYSLLIYGLFSLGRLVASCSGTWMSNHSKSNLLPKIRLQPSEEEIEQHAHLLFQQIDSQLTICDIKAYLTIMADALLVIFLTFAETQSLRRAFQAGTPQIQRIAAMCLFLVLVMLVCSCYSALRTILPTLQDRNRISLLYFGHIAELQHDKFVSNFQNQPLRELKESLLSEIHSKAKIARRKLTLTSWSTSFFFASLLLWIAAQLLFMLQV